MRTLTTTCMHGGGEVVKKVKNLRIYYVHDPLGRSWLSFFRDLNSSEKGQAFIQSKPK